MTAATAVIFPFDLFGSSGTGAGAQLLGDALREALADTAEEERTTRPHCFYEKLDIEELLFDTLEQLSEWRSAGREVIRELLGSNQFVLWLAGNHLGTLPIYDELGAGDLVIQFDAHLDCYALHDTTEELSHGNFLLSIEKPRPTIVNVGHRDLFLVPKDVKKTFAAAIPTDEIATDLEKVLAALREHVANAKRVWIDIDADVFDPAFAPAVHTPAPFGLTPTQFLARFEASWSEKVIGVSMSEFDPGRDVRDLTLNLLGWLTERVLLKKCE